MKTTKKILLLLAGTLLAAGVAGCQSESGDEPEEVASTPAVSVSQSNPETNDAEGRYLCTSLRLEEADLTSEGQYLELQEGGVAIIALSQDPDVAQWTLSGTTLTLSVSGETIGQGTLENGVLTITLMGADGVFTKEGITLVQEETTQPDPAQSEAEDTGTDETADEDTAAFSCCDDLYLVDYPTDVFQPSGDGLTDLTAEDGTKAWITKLNSKEMVESWLTGFDEKEASQEEFSRYDDIPAGDYTAQAIVYHSEDGWHSEILVNFGKDKGNKTYPMYAAYLYFTGPEQESVWNETIQGMVGSLRLGE